MGAGWPLGRFGVSAVVPMDPWILLGGEVQVGLQVAPGSPTEPMGPPRTAAVFCMPTGFQVFHPPVLVGEKCFPPSPIRGLCFLFALEL